jgi:predicted nucleotidyltransferase
LKVKKAGKVLQEIIQILKEHREELRGTYKVKRLKVFGSYAKNKQTENSDLDLVVSFEETPTLLEFIDLKEYLEDITGIKVDLVTEEGISPYIKPYIKEIEVL